LIEDIEKQIQELKRQRNNLIELTIKSKELDAETLDHHLTDNRRALGDLIAYERKLEN